MFDKIIQFSIRNKLAVGFFVIAIILCGAYSISTLPIDATPDITPNQVEVMTLSPKLGALEAEQLITAPIELALSNVPGVIERRSLSRPGLSVVTLVFNDNADIYWAREQVYERLSEVNIDKSLGEPSLEPISSGLGEIYSYTLHTQPGYEKKYTTTDLRTIQDWIVTRQLAGTPGIVDINAWGGYVKQYEVAVDNEKLNAAGITIPEVFKALSDNNESAGGSYIESHDNAYFIRGLGQVKTLADIGKIVIKNINGTPVLIRDVAKVDFGSAPRYGAITRNGAGEVVGGVALMLKGANFSDVIKSVKSRIAAIQKTLPRGIVIDPIIDRTALVGRTIGTVERNLIEGGLIVIFVLVLLLGNFRAGLVVASVIPLAMLFAASLMKLTGVSGNLMSLGAIDFGIIVDGAVIIVEAIVHRITEGKLSAKTALITQDEMDNQVYHAASKIRNSAAFGEIIILIVYLPIFSLAGVEGKMFHPMAQTVAYAVLGAFILSLTYVPMMSALFLSKSTVHKRSLSDRIMDTLHRVYDPLLQKALKARVLVVALSVLLLGLSLWVFSGLGGVFLPTLEEGDFALEVRLVQGISLTKSIETYTKMEQMLKKEIPDIKQVVSKIGTAEIPTDPTPLGGADVMIAMKPKEQWVTAHTMDEMVAKIQSVLSAFPGADVEVSQPIQMRFNELLSGIKQDVAIKIFGDNLDALSSEAEKVSGLIAWVPGVDQPKVEKVIGLPQIEVDYNRDKIAQYGLNISDINNVLKTAFAGSTAGYVYEGEKKFELVVRMAKDSAESIGQIRNLYLPLAGSGRIPLSEVADVNIKDAPEEISREDGNRRIYVGFNVKGRDVESVVNDIRVILDKQLKLPPGYYIKYGGQYQNLVEAKQRLSVAVPAAILLILILLFFTFHSVRQTLLIITAVPLSAIGGVFALWIRSMPFSISAGIGFIALFGVAVLNGIVLIGYFNQLEAEGITDIYERVKKGAKVRFRPVVMTASVASLGFLPMALSTSAGAEVQKPLATVVIGGLISATLLTLVLLPVLYTLFSPKNKMVKRSKIIGKTWLILLLCNFGLFHSSGASAQTKTLTVDECIGIALKNNLQIRSSALSVQSNLVLQKTAFSPGTTAIDLSQSPTSTERPDKIIGISQNLEFPTVYTAQAHVLSGQTQLARNTLEINQNVLIRDVKAAYFNLAFTMEKLKLLVKQDSLYRKFTERADLRYKTGETSNLERLSAAASAREVAVQLNNGRIDLQNNQLELRRLLNSTDTIIPNQFRLPDNAFELTDTVANPQNPALRYYDQLVKISADQTRLERARLLPGLSFGYAELANDRTPLQPGMPVYPTGFQVGVDVPLFFGAQSARIKAAKIQQSIAGMDLELEKNNLDKAIEQQANECLKLRQAINYYDKGVLKQTEELLKVSGIAYGQGEIGYVEYTQNITQYVSSHIMYLETVNQFNQALIELKYLKGEK
jgi:cobalt-zinc-cadmium resistance protein CzcA